MRRGLESFSKAGGPVVVMFRVISHREALAEPKPLNRYRESGLREASVFLYPMITFSKGRGDRVFSVEKSTYF